MPALTPEQLDILTKTVLGEARPNDPEGQAAVAWVIRNRAQSGQFPSDPAKVAKQKYQFSAWNDKSNGGNDQVRTPSTSKHYQAVSQIVQQVFSDQWPDPTGGATYYHTPAVNPTWDNNMSKTAELGGHIFFSPDKNAPFVANIDQIGTLDPRLMNVLGYDRTLPPLQSMPATPGMTPLPAPAPLSAPGMVPGRNTKQMYKVDDLVPSVDGTHKNKVEIGPDGFARFVRQPNPGEIPGVMDPYKAVGDNRVPSLVGSYINSHPEIAGPLQIAKAMGLTGPQAAQKAANPPSIPNVAQNVQATIGNVQKAASAAIPDVGNVFKDAGNSAVNLLGGLFGNQTSQPPRPPVNIPAYGPGTVRPGSMPAAPYMPTMPVGGPGTFGPSGLPFAPIAAPVLHPAPLPVMPRQIGTPPGTQLNLTTNATRPAPPPVQMVQIASGRVVPSNFQGQRNGQGYAVQSDGSILHSGGWSTPGPSQPQKWWQINSAGGTV